MAGSGQEDCDAAGGAAPFSPACLVSATFCPKKWLMRAMTCMRMFSRRGDVIDPAALIREVMHRVTVWQAPSTGLDDDTDHVEWLPAAKAAIDWRFWDRYRRYQEEVKLMPRQVIWRLDETTDRVLGKLENPNREGRWRRSGLVVGQVQSGKTGNYIGLACKAADAGYKLIVILAGIDNSLRSQTQLRVDEGFIGFDTQYQQRYDEERQSSYIGVGLLRGAPRLTGRIADDERGEGRLREGRREEHQHPRRRLPGRARH